MSGSMCMAYIGFLQYGGEMETALDEVLAWRYEAESAKSIQPRRTCTASLLWPS